MAGWSLFHQMAGIAQKKGQSRQLIGMVADSGIMAA